MHPSPHFRHADPALRDEMIRAHPFATIFCATEHGPRAAQSPVHLAGSDILRFHLARGNVLVRSIESERVLAVIHGPQAYISARWYTEPNAVPTWNYVSYELEGTVTRLDKPALLALLEALSEANEARIVHGTPWTMDKMDAAYRDRLMRGIVGFEMRIEETRETVKLAQQKSPCERAHLIEGLEREGSDTMARLMRSLPRATSSEETRG